jgi:hypothetical protein
LKPAEGSFHTLETVHDRISKISRLFYKETARTMATTLERYNGTKYPRCFLQLREINMIEEWSTKEQNCENITGTKVTGPKSCPGFKSQ